MPLIALDDIPAAIRRHTRYEFLSQDPKKVLPSSVHWLLDLLKPQHLWQFLTLSGREITDQMLTLGIQDTNIPLGTIRDTLFPLGLAVRENTPFAIRVERTPPVFVRSLSETTKTFTNSYADATYYWNRWRGFQAQARFAPSIPEKTRLVFRSESLKWGHDPFKTVSVL